MVHKAGDNVFVKAKVINNSQNGECRVYINDETILWLNDELIVKNDSMTAEEAWELAWDIYKMDGRQMQDIFGVTNAMCGVLEKYTAHEAKEKIDSWIKSKGITIGYVYEHKIYKDIKIVVTSIIKSEIHYIDFDGLCNSCSEYKFKNSFIKTNKSIDVASFLGQIGETHETD